MAPAVAGRDGHATGRERLGDISFDRGPFRRPLSLAIELWTLALRRARASGELRADLGFDEIVVWIASVHVLFLIAPELDARRFRETLEKVVVPALIEPMSRS